ncbi:MAG: helix-turn-helix domain-containing protein [Nostocales cyanobacterium]|nr:MAG: helix-turn-helix domain-containing protein [Nostocales cyanobacterium]
MKWLRKKDETPSQPSIEQQQSEKLTELGAKLAALRQQQGLSLDEIVLTTRIPGRLLNAIEAGDLSDLPEPIYIQGLIRQFADVLGLKGVEFASHFPIGTQQVSFQRNWQPKPFFQLRPVHLYLLYIFVIICSVNGLSQLLNQTALQANNRGEKPSLKTDSDLTLQTLQAKNVQETQAVEIGVTLKSSSWIRVVADGKTEFEGVLPEGSQRNWKASEQLTVKTDNAGGVLMSVNQQKPKEMGKPGKVEEIRIAAKVKS